MLLLELQLSFYSEDTVPYPLKYIILFENLHSSQKLSFKYFSTPKFRIVLNNLYAMLSCSWS